MIRDPSQEGATYLSPPLISLRHAMTSQARALDQVSSGRRINRAADDAAGLAVAENLDVRAQGARVAQRNILDGQALLHTTDSASGQVNDMLKRLRELAVQSASETLHDDERAYIERERVQLTDEIDRMANSTDLFGKTWTNGATASVAVQVGAGAGDQIDIAMGDLRSASLGVDTLDFSTAAGARTALDTLDSAIDAVSRQRSVYGASMNRLDSAYALAEDQEFVHTEAASRIRDVDMAEAVSEMARTQILVQTSILSIMKVNEFNRAMMSQLLS